MNSDKRQRRQAVRVGVYAGAKVTAGAVVSFAVMMNSGGVLDVLGER